MKTLLIDDERLARAELRTLLKTHNNIDIVDEACDGHSAVEKIHTLKPDLVFLDIQMPGMDGFEVLENLDYLPQVIFVTAYDEHAIRAFEYSALDYLMKPVDPQRLAQAIDKLQKTETNQEDKQRELSENEKVFLKDGDHCWFVRIGDINAIESIGNYSRVYFGMDKPLIRRSLNQLEERLPKKLFFRANRQTIINLQHIATVDTEINGNLLITMNNGEKVELSRRQSLIFREELKL